MSRPEPGRRARLSAAAAMVVVLTGCASEPPRTVGERAADDALTASVEQALTADANIYARHIDVNTRRGVVHLSGYVWSSNELYEAQRIAATVPGVTGVVDQLELVVGGRTGSR